MGWTSGGTSNGGWGNLSASINVTGSQLQTNIGEEGTEGEINAGWGRKLGTIIKVGVFQEH